MVTAAINAVKGPTLGPSHEGREEEWDLENSASYSCLCCRCSAKGGDKSGQRTHPLYPLPVKEGEHNGVWLLFATGTDAGGGGQGSNKGRNEFPEELEEFFFSFLFHSSI